MKKHLLFFILLAVCCLSLFAENSDPVKYESTTVYSSTGNKTVYAHWTPITYTVVYNGNGNTGGSTASQTFSYDETKALNSNGFTKTGYSFAGWATSSGGSVVYSNGQRISNLSSTNGGTVNLYAKWTPNTYTVYFNYNTSNLYDTSSYMSGTGTSSQSVTYNGTYGSLPSPSKTGYTFLGWWDTAAGNSNRYYSSSTYTVAGNQTLYAKWQMNTRSDLTASASGAWDSGQQSDSVNTGNYYMIVTKFDGRCKRRKQYGQAYFGGDLSCTHATLYHWTTSWDGSRYCRLDSASVIRPNTTVTGYTGTRAPSKFLGGESETGYFNMTVSSAPVRNSY